MSVFKDFLDSGNSYRMFISSENLKNCLDFIIDLILMSHFSSKITIFKVNEIYSEVMSYKNILPKNVSIHGRNSKNSETILKNYIEIKVVSFEKIYKEFSITFIGEQTLTSILNSFDLNL